MLACYFSSFQVGVASGVLNGVIALFVSAFVLKHIEVWLKSEAGMRTELALGQSLYLTGLAMILFAFIVPNTLNLEIVAILSGLVTSAVFAKHFLIKSKPAPPDWSFGENSGSKKVKK